MRFQVVVPEVEEVPGGGEGPEAYVRRLAVEKAQAVPAEVGDTVLAADTVVVAAGGAILEKPRDAADAARMLRKLAGSPHVVLTGICLRKGGEQVVDVARTTVWFEELRDAEIEAYAASGEPFDKAGGYAIQGLASKFVRRIEGCYFNVVGLPVSLVYRHLRERGWGTA